MKKILLVASLLLVAVAVFYYMSDWRIQFNREQVLKEVRNYVESTKETEASGPKINPENLIWKAATTDAPWTKRDSEAAIVFDNKMWIFGGLHGLPTAENNYGVAPHFNDIWSSTDGINWILEREHADWSPRRSMSVEYFRGKLWMFGGWSNTTGYKTGIWASDDAIHWKQITKDTPWPAREGQSSAVFQGKLWMIGGIEYGKKLGDQNLKSDVWNSEDGVNWNRVIAESSWSGRYDHGVAVFNDKLWVAGGLIHGKALNDVWSSDDGKNWMLENINAPWEERHGFPFLNYKNKLWIISGWGTIHEAGTQDVWYSADGKNWRKAGEDFSWPGREDQTGLVFKNKMWILGGMGPFWKWNNDVWYSSFGN